MMTPAYAPCIGCGGRFDADDPDASHDYMHSSSGCWSSYGLLLAREYQRPSLFAACHRLTVDAYAVQHRGAASDRRAVRSVWLHFASLHAVFVDGRPLDQGPAIIKAATAFEFRPLPVDTPAFPSTLADVLARPAADHVRAVQQWARSSFAAWRPTLEPELRRLGAIA